MLHSAISRLLRPSDRQLEPQPAPEIARVAQPPGPPTRAGVARAGVEVPSAVQPAAETAEKPAEIEVCNTVTPSGETLVADLISFLARYLVCSDHQRLVLALWIIHTHCSSAAQYTPYLDIRSASKQSGKSLCLQLLKFLCRESMLTCGLTAAVLSERLASNSATLLLDEREATVGSLQRSRNPALRALLACGFQHGATCSHRSGDRTIYSPKAFAGTASLPESLAERCIPIDLEPGRPAQRFRRQAIEEASALRQLLEQWAKDNLQALENSDVCCPADFPEGLSLRQQDCIEPLLHIADRIGADWGTKAREALLALFHQRLKLERQQGVLLLRAVCEAFVLHKFPERLSSQDLLIWLHTREHRPWDRETPITAQRLATELHPFNVGPRLQRVGNRVARGYRVEDVKAAYHNFLEAEEEGRVATTNYHGAQPPGSPVCAGVAHTGVEVPSAATEVSSQADRSSNDNSAPPSAVQSAVTPDQTAITADFAAHAPATSNDPKAKNSAPARRTSQGREYQLLYDREWLQFINSCGYEPIPPDDQRPAIIHIACVPLRKIVAL